MKDQTVSMGQAGRTICIERAEARKLGRVRYFTGRPCRHGHVAERYVVSGSCIECLRLSQLELHAYKSYAVRCLLQGKLSKKRAIAMGSPWYCEGWGLDCGHIAVQRVIDDKCKMCLDQEERAVKQQLDLAKELLS